MTYTDNVFIATEINNNLIAIDGDKLTYLKLTQSDLDNCVRDNSQYICTHSMPIYRVHHARRKCTYNDNSITVIKNI